VAAFFEVGIGQLERAGLGCQAKNQPRFSGKAIDWNLETLNGLATEAIP
jgi:hypothetical protein